MVYDTGQVPVQVPVQASGAYVPVQITDTFTWPDYLQGGKDPEADRNVLIYFTYAMPIELGVDGYDALRRNCLSAASRAGMSSWKGTKP